MHPAKSTTIDYVGEKEQGNGMVERRMGMNEVLENQKRIEARFDRFDQKMDNMQIAINKNDKKIELVNLEITMLNYWMRTAVKWLAIPVGGLLVLGFASWIKTLI